MTAAGQRSRSPVPQGRPGPAGSRRATAHYVTPDLDEGPIIAQDVIPVNHAHTPADLVAVGSDAEAQTLSRAVKWHAEGRVVVSGNRTIVLA